MQTALATLAATGGVAMGLAPILQIRRMRAQSSAEEVSLGLFVIMLANFITWILYGGSIGEWAIVIPNVVAAITASATIIVVLQLRKESAAD